MKSIWNIISSRVLSVEKGYALPVILLLLATLSAVALVMINTSRSITTMAAARTSELQARQAADAGYEAFIARTGQSGRQIRYAEISLEIGNARVVVTNTNEFSKIDLNIGAPQLLRGLFRSLEFSSSEADRMTSDIVEFRGSSNERIFYSADGLLQLSSIDISRLERIRPFVTVYSASPGVDVAAAPADVIAAIPGISRETAERIAVTRGDTVGLTSAEIADLSRFWSQSRPVFTIVSTARIDDETEFVREAVVDLSEPRRPIVLNWERGFARGVRSPDTR